ncbi:MAG: ATPase, T2SS/T4P/T4SS family, partial [bacterium]
EIRDMETMRSALAYAETGHLCVSTLHANNANQAIDRIINFFPDEGHKQIRKDLALNLRAIVSQRLPKSTDGKRVAAVEVMLNTPLISDLIEKGEIEKIKKAMIQANILGCQTFDDALFNLVQTGKIGTEEALQHADSRNDLSLRFRLEGGSRPKKIKKDVAYAKHVDFDDYRTFIIRRLSVPDDLIDRVSSVEEAMRNTLISKGLEESSKKPDIELQYVFTSKTIEPERMEDVENAISSGINVGPEVKKYGTLKINIVDLDSRKAVWQVVASREIAIQPSPQKEIDKDMDFLFDEFPPRPLEIAE